MSQIYSVLKSYYIDLQTTQSLIFFNVYRRVLKPSISCLFLFFLSANRPRHRASFRMLKSTSKQIPMLSPVPIAQKKSTSFDLAPYPKPACAQAFFFAAVGISNSNTVAPNPPVHHAHQGPFFRPQTHSNPTTRQLWYVPDRLSDLTFAIVMGSVAL